jgi:carbon storage regulator
MLVLTRRTDESLTIGDSITVTILGIEGDKVKLGIKAPRDITILRQEIFEAVQAQNLLEKKLAEGLEPDSFKELRDLLAENSEDALGNQPTTGDPTGAKKPAQQ